MKNILHNSIDHTSSFATKTFLGILALPLASLLMATSALGRDQDQMQGTWKVVQFQATHERGEDAKVRAAKMIIADNKLSMVLEGEKTETNAFALEEFSSPKIMNLLNDSGKTVARFIYELNGNRLTMAWNQSVQTLPEALDPQKAENYLVVERLGAIRKTGISLSENQFNSSPSELQGDWKALIAQDSHGAKTANKLGDFIMKIEGNVLTTISNSNRELCQLEVRSDVSPPQLVVTSKAKRTVLIYRIQGDYLTLCGQSNGEAPTEFSTRGEGQMLTLVRVR